MVEYACNICNYTTTRLNNLKSHNATQKHKEMEALQKKILNEKKKYTCNNCGSEFNDRSNMRRHKIKSCENNINNNTTNQQTNTDLIGVIVTMMNKYEENQKMLFELLKHNGQVAQINGETAKVQSETVATSMRTLNYAIKHLTQAPPLKKLNKDKAIKLLEYEAKNKNHSIETIMINKFKNNELHEFLGNIVIGECINNKDKNKISIYACDISRLSFIIRQRLDNRDDNNIIDEWITDKEGIKFRNLIIRPLFDEAIKMIQEYQQSGHNILHNKISDDSISYNSQDNLYEINDDKIKKIELYFGNIQLENLSEHLSKCVDAIIYMRKKQAEKDLLTYVAPHFNLYEINKNKIH
jgi:hypothetical protein